MSARRLGVATIGQAPREDIRGQFAAFAPPGTEVVLRGCLDDETDAAIAAHPPRSGADALYTRLRGDRDAVFSKAWVVEKAPATLERLRADGCGAIVFACTGDFPPMPGDAGVIFPSRLLAGIAGAVLPRGRMGLVLPLAEQGESLAAKWRRPGVDLVIEALRPSASPEEIRVVARRLAAARVDLVALDCMSYGEALRAEMRAVTGVPALLAVATAGRVVGEMLA